MPNLFVTEAAVNAALGDRKTLLLDWDGDGAADTGLLATLIERAGRIIVARTAQRYGSSAAYAQITATPATPELIQEIALDLTLWLIYRHTEPAGRDAVTHWDLADGMLTGILKGDLDVLGVARAAAHEGRRIVVATYEDPVVSGVDSSGADRLRGV